jgi:hypothetical protein
MTEIVLNRKHDAIGEIAVRPVDPDADVHLLHSWLTHPKCGFWGMLDYSVDDVRRRFTDIADSTTHDDFIGLHEGQPAFLFEIYDTASELGPTVYPAQQGDKSFHFLVAPREKQVPRLSITCLKTVIEFLFDDPEVLRIVGEPDVRNRAMLILIRKVGGRIEREIDLPDKRAQLCTLTREDYYTALAAAGEANMPS